MFLSMRRYGIYYLPGDDLTPKIIEFLGYDPFPEISTTFGQEIKQYRRIKGLSIKKFAKQLGADPTTLARWESDNSKISGKKREALRVLLDSSGKAAAESTSP